MTLKKKNIFSVTVPILIGTVISIIFTYACERFDPESILVFKTESVEELTEGQYRLTGRVINIGNEKIIQHGFCWSASENPTISDQVTRLGTKETAGTFTSIISELPPDVKIFVRAYVTTSKEPEYGKNKAFTTPPPNLPEVETAPVGAITVTSAVSGGNVISEGGDPVSARGVCWSTLENPTLADNHTTDGSGMGEFGSSLSGLTCSNEYFVRAYATNFSGTAYGDQMVFTTSECEPAEGVLIFSDSDGTWLLNHEGVKTPYKSDGNRDLEVFENKIYIHWGHNVSVYNPQGDLIRSIAVDNRITNPYKMCVLPGENLAFFDNYRDTVSFTNSAGELVKTMSFTNAPPGENLQSVNGVVVENSLIISEDGNNQLVRIDLDNYQWSVFKDFQHLTGWLGDIDYANGNYYMVQSTKIYSFTEDEGENLVCELPEGNNIGLAVHGNFAYVTSNFGNKVYRVNLQNGSYEIILSEANYPEDIELIE
ncbi:MAG: hypothetical protein ACT6FG_01300 [Methanosarcinaceae archaeon]